MKITYLIAAMIFLSPLTSYAGKAFSVSALKSRLASLMLLYGNDIHNDPNKQKRNNSSDDEQKLTRRQKKEREIRKNILKRHSYYNKKSVIKNLFLDKVKANKLTFRDEKEGRAVFLFTPEQDSMVQRQVFRNKGKKLSVTGRFQKLSDAIIFNYVKASVQH